MKLNPEIKKTIKFQVRIGNVTKDKIEKSIMRNARKEVKRLQPVFNTLLEECGGGKSRSFVYGFNTVEEIVHRADKNNYPKPTPKYKPEPIPAMNFDINA
jgi:hypothetical protein